MERYSRAFGLPACRTGTPLDLGAHLNHCAAGLDRLIVRRANSRATDGNPHRGDWLASTRTFCAAIGGSGSAGASRWLGTLDGEIQAIQAIVMPLAGRVIQAKVGIEESVFA